MRLKTIEVAGFRAFNDPQELNLDSDLVIVSGDNHTGKTSLAEAIEWLLCGYTLRCERGKEYSKTEYADIYRNVHFPEGQSPYVQLTAVHEGRNMTLRRELLTHEASQAYLDGSRVADFSMLGYSETGSRPVIAQHALRDFIDTRPKTRREILSYVLGLDGLLKLQSNLQETHTELTRRKDQQSTVYNNLAARLGTLPALAALASHLQEGAITEGRAELIDQARTLAGEPSPEDSHLSFRLSEVETHIRARVINAPKYHVDEVIPAQAEALLERIRRFVIAVESAIGSLAALARGTEPAYDKRKESFLALGIELVDPLHPRTCPFCGEETLTEETIGQHASIIQSHAEEAKAQADSEAQILDLAPEYQAISNEVSAILPRLPSGQDLQRIRATLDGKHELEKYDFVRDDMSLNLDSWHSLDQETTGSLSSLREHPARKTVEGALTQCQGLVSRLEGVVATLLLCRSSYYRQWVDVRPLIEAAIATDAQVKQVSLLRDMLDAWPQVAAGLRYRAIETKFSGLEAALRTYTAKKQQERLEEKEHEIREWYELLNPDEDVTFGRISVTKTSLGLKGYSFGTEIEAPPNFSQSQINCLGLAVYLIQATSSGDMGFILLDDPVQSMDDTHSERLKADILDRLLDSGHQVILLSHLHTWAEGISTHHRWRFPDRIEFAGYSRTGPVIEEKPPALWDFIDQAREYQAGNAERRRLASGCVRRALERVVKLLYMQAQGTLPTKYRDASFPILQRDLLPKCSQLSPREADGIRSSYEFVVSHPHDDMIVEPPSAEQLEPHISRLYQLCEKHVLFA